MSDKQVVVKSGGTSMLGLLGVVFVTLKLLGITAVASWSWWWVTVPFWGVLALALVVTLVSCLLMALCAGVLAIVEHFSK